MITQTEGECPVCYGVTGEYSCYEFDPAYEEASVGCTHPRCYGEEHWCGNSHWDIFIRGHRIQFGGWYGESQQDRKSREAAIKIVLKAARECLIEDLRANCKA